MPGGNSNHNFNHNSKPPNSNSNSNSNSKPPNPNFNFNSNSNPNPNPNPNFNSNSNSKPPNSSFSAQSNHHRSQFKPSTSTSAAGDHKPSVAGKSKPSPKPTTATPNNRDSKNKKPSPQQLQQPFFPEPPPPPSYGFHMLDRRSIVLADGSVRSYFALPLDYQNFPILPRQPGFRPEFRVPNDFVPERPNFIQNAEFMNPENWNNSVPENSLKRKFGEEGGDGLERQRRQLLQYGNANSEIRPVKNKRTDEGNSSKIIKRSEVDQIALKKAFLHFVKVVFETENYRKNFLADGKQGSLPCLACRSSKDFPDAHTLIVHSYNSESADSIVDHLALHKALCILMGWNYSTPPDNSKSYQKNSKSEAESNRDDLIMWPPTVLIHNTVTGKHIDGRLEGLGNKAMDSILRDLGFTSGKSMSLYSREGHLGIHAVKFPGDESGLKDALRLADYFEREKRGRRAWAHVQPLNLGGKDDEKNPNLVKFDSNSITKDRVLYGHLGTVVDLDKVTFEIKKKVTIVSKREYSKSK